MNYHLLNTRQIANASVPVLSQKKFSPWLSLDKKKKKNGVTGVVKSADCQLSRCFQGPVKGTQNCDTRGQTEGMYALSYYYQSMFLSCVFFRGSHRLAERHRASGWFQVPPMVRRHCAFPRRHDSGKVTIWVSCAMSHSDLRGKRSMLEVCVPDYWPV